MTKAHYLFIGSGIGGLMVSWIAEHASFFQGLAAILSVLSLSVGLSIRLYKWYKKGE